jgi:HD domain
VLRSWLEEPVESGERSAPGGSAPCQPEPEPQPEPLSLRLTASPRPLVSRRLLRRLPLSLLVTLVVIVAPVAVVTLLMPAGHGLTREALAVVLAVAGSLALASAGAWLWQRWPGSRETIFAELLLWGWARQAVVERRLIGAREVFAAARRGESAVTVELLAQLSALVQALDPYVHGHSRRVASHAGRIARQLGLEQAAIASIESAALMHDVGKIYTPPEILHKPGRLTDGEFAIVKLHAPDGAELIAQAGDSEMAAIVRHHHERLDGGGYPDGIAGEGIPLGARIIAVADTFDAITSARPYRAPRTHKQAIDVLHAEAGRQLDATVVAAFIACYAARRPVTGSALASAVPEQALAALKAASLRLAAAGSVAQTLPALGVAGLLAAVPALGLHHGAAGSRHGHGPAGTRSAPSVARGVRLSAAGGAPTRGAHGGGAASRAGNRGGPRASILPPRATVVDDAGAPGGTRAGPSPATPAASPAAGGGAPAAEESGTSTGGERSGSAAPEGPLAGTTTPTTPPASTTPSPVPIVPPVRVAPSPSVTTPVGTIGLSSPATPGSSLPVVEVSVTTGSPPSVSVRGADVTAQTALAPATLDAVAAPGAQGLSPGTGS